MQRFLLLILLLGCYPAGLSQTGGTCEIGSDCEGGVCITEWKVGYCSNICTLQSECQSWEQCVRFDNNPEAHCFASCWYDEDCWYGHYCRWWIFARDGICIPHE